MDSLINLTGLNSIGYLSNKYIDIVLIGEKHCAYNPYEDNSLHEWINPDITMQPTSFIFCESDNMRDDINHTIWITPRYFLPKNITFMDPIRHSFGIIYNISDVDNITKIYDYVKEVHEKSPILQLPKLHDCVFNGVSPLTVMNASFINCSIRDKTLYSLDTSENPNLAQQTLSEFMKVYNHSSNENRLVQKMYHYELLMLHYLHFNFIYTVINWIKTHKQIILEPNDILWRIVNSWVVKNTEINTIKIQTIILDYVFIINILNKYTFIKTNKIKHLIWVPAGNAHTLSVFAFLTKLFIYTFKNDEKFVHKNIVVYGDSNAKNEITDLFINNPNLGFRKPINVDKKLDIDEFEKIWNANKGQHININTYLKEQLELNYPYCIKYSNNIISNLLYDIPDLKFITKILTMINDKSVLKPQIDTEFAALFAIPINTLLTSKILIKSSYGKSVVYTDNIYGFSETKYLRFDEPFTSTYIPVITDNEKTQINVYKMNNLLQEKTTVLMSELQQGENILLLPNNNREKYNDVEPNSIYFYLYTLYEKYTSNEKKYTFLGSPELRREVISKIIDDLISKYRLNSSMNENDKLEIDTFFNERIKEIEDQYNIKEMPNMYKTVVADLCRILVKKHLNHTLIIRDEAEKMINQTKIKPDSTIGGLRTHAIMHLDKIIRSLPHDPKSNINDYIKMTPIMLDIIERDYLKSQPKDTTMVSQIMRNFNYDNIQNGEQLFKELQIKFNEQIYLDINEKIKIKTNFYKQVLENARDDIVIKYPNHALIIHDAAEKIMNETEINLDTNIGVLRETAINKLNKIVESSTPKPNSDNYIKMAPIMLNVIKKDYLKPKAGDNNQSIEARKANSATIVQQIMQNFDYNNIQSGEQLLQTLRDKFTELTTKTGGNEVCFRFSNVFLIAILIMVVLYMMYVVYHIHLRKSKCDLRYRY